MILLITSSLFVFNPNVIVDEAEAYTTPGTGVAWTMVELEAATTAVFNSGPSSYIIVRSVTIHAADTLNIQEGDLIEFMSGNTIYVNGTMNVNGTDSNGVVFQKGPFQSAWGGIHYNSSSSGKIEYATITGADTGIYINNTNLFIRNSILYRNNVGVYINDSTPFFDNITINDSVSDGISCFNSDLTITNHSDISSNGPSGISLVNSILNINDSFVNANLGNGIVLSDGSTGNIDNLTMIDNSMGGGESNAAIFMENSTMTLTDSNLTNNEANGINITSGSTANIDNVTIINGSQNGIFVTDSVADISNVNVTTARVGIFAWSLSNVKAINFTGYKINHTGLVISGSKNVTCENFDLTMRTSSDGEGYVGVNVVQSNGNIDLRNFVINNAYNLGMYINYSSLYATQFNIAGSFWNSIIIDNSSSVELSSFNVARPQFGHTINVTNSRNINITDNSVINSLIFHCIDAYNTTLNIVNSSLITPLINKSLRLNLSQVVALNSEIGLDGVYFNDTESDITRYYHLSVWVYNITNVAQFGANVVIKNDKGITVLDRLTGTGDPPESIRWYEAFENYQNTTVSITNDTYDIIVSKIGYRTYTTQITLQHMINDIIVKLAPNKGPSDITNLQPTSTHKDILDITWDASTDPEGDNITYRIIINNGTTDIYDNVTANNYFNITTPLNYQTYNINISAIDEFNAQGNITLTTLDIVNNKPSTPVITLEPVTPNTDDTLMLNLTTPSIDIDTATEPSELIRYTVKWYKNGAEQVSLELTNQTLAQVNHTTIAAALTTIGDIWMVKVTPYDGHNSAWQLSGASGAHSNGTPVTAQVTIINRAPIVSNPLQDFTMLEDTVDSIHVNLNNNFTEPDSETMTFGFADADNIVVSINAGVVTFAPPLNWYGSDHINFTASDGKAQASAGLWVHVSPVNDAPVIDPISDITGYEDVQFAIYLHGNDTADPADVLAYTTNISTAIPGIVVVEQTSTYGKKLLVTADNSMVGIYMIRYTLNDGAGEANSIVTDDFQLTIINTNDPPAVPVITSPAHLSEFIQGTDIPFAGYCSDPDEIHGQTLTYTWKSDRDGSFGTQANETLYDGLSLGTHIITLDVTDSIETRTSSSITITIKEPIPEVTANVTLLSPANNSKVNTLKVTLTWKSYHTQASLFTYTVKMDTNLVPQTEVSTVTTNSLEVDVEDGKKYYWTVVPKYSDNPGVTTNGIFNFEVDTKYVEILPTCYLSTPVDDATESTTSVDLTWTSDHARKLEFTYHVYWSSTEFDVDNLPTDTDSTTDTTYKLTGLTDNTKYWWTVVPQLFDTPGTCLSDPSVWAFTVDTGFVAEDVELRLLAPADGTTVSENLVTLKWEPLGTNAASFTFKVYASESSDPVNDTIKASGISTPQYDLAVEDGKTYYWTVIPSYQGGDGKSISGVWSFDVDFGFKEEKKLDITGGGDLELKPGGSKAISYTVKNSGNVPQTILVGVDSGDLSGVTADPESISFHFSR
jgi:hypothetical protein